MSDFEGSVREHTIRLQDGRHLSYLEIGDATGTPLFYFPGNPGSRLEGLIVAETALRLGVRLISLDLPGVGRSDFQARRRLLDWPDDVERVANAAGLDRFAVAGVSSGTPHVAACAYKIPHRLTACGIISGWGPTGSLPIEGMPLASRATWFAFQHLPWGVKLLVDWMARAGHDEEKCEAWFLRMTKHAPEADPDRILFLDPTLRKQAVKVWVDGFRQGTQGIVQNLRLVYAADWGFRLQDIRCEHVFLWHGEADRNVPLSMAHAVTRAMPQCRATFVPNEGHMSVAMHCSAEILETLTLAR